MYLDTSVIGGCVDDEFREESLRLVARARDGKLILVISDATMAELSEAPQEVWEILKTLGPDSIEYVDHSYESEALAQEYLAAEVLPKKMLADAEHIAIATVARVDVLVSWNFKHIVNLNRIRGFNAINLRAGYPMLEIRSPLEIIGDEKEEV